MSGHSKSTLFLMEQIVVITVFAICAAVCVNIIVTSYLMTMEAVDTKNALITAESAAESFKATGGDTRRTTEILSESISSYFSDNAILIYYDNNWKPSGEAQAYFVLQLIKNDADPRVIFGDITISNKETGNELISLPVAVRRGAL